MSRRCGLNRRLNRQRIFQKIRMSPFPFLSPFPFQKIRMSRSPFPLEVEVNQRTFITGAVCILFLLTCAYLLSVQRNRLRVPYGVEGMDIRDCRRYLYMIGNFTKSYVAQEGVYPPVCVKDENGVQMHGWRVTFMKHEDPSSMSRWVWGEPWNSPTNAAQWDAHILSDPTCPPERLNGGGVVFTKYLAVTGPGTVWPKEGFVRPADITDDPRSTLVVVESVRCGVCWSEPRDFDVTTLYSHDRFTLDEVGIRSDHYERRSKREQELYSGAHVLFASGDVDYLFNDTPPEVIRAMVTIAGGEELEKDDNSGWRWRLKDSPKNRELGLIGNQTKPTSNKDADAETKRGP